MSEEATIVQLPVVQQSGGTTPSPTVPVELSLPPHEIERICKAFIRLITAEEIATHEEDQNGKQPAPTRATTAPRNRRYLRQIRNSSTAYKESTTNANR